MKYQCKICGYVYDGDILFDELNDDYVCPMCYSPKSLFSLTKIEEKEENVFNYAIKISKNNLGVEKEDAKCIDCGACKQTCIEKVGLDVSNDPSLCLACGQCILTCPTNALKPKSSIENIKKAIEEGKTLICYTSPAVRVSIGEAFGYESGTFLQGKLISLLRALGFNYVFDTTFGADLTIMEEANELVNRIKNNGVLPMFSSCCPAWVKYCNIKYPDFVKHLSTCKSPIGMEGAIVENFFLKEINKKKEDVLTVAITPCTAKKMEIKLDLGTDEVLTVRELVSFAKEKGIDFNSLDDGTYDEFLKEGSGAGTIFGSTGGVCLAAIRTAYYLLTGNNLDLENISLKEIEGMDYVKEGTIFIDGVPLSFAVVHKISRMPEFLKTIESKNYAFVEVMNCEGGCVGGGGQPKLDAEYERIGKIKRKDSLYMKDKNDKVRFSHENKNVLEIYEKYLGEPGSMVAKKLLHRKESKVDNKIKNFN